MRTISEDEAREIIAAQKLRSHCATTIETTLYYFPGDEPTAARPRATMSAVVTANWYDPKHTVWELHEREPLADIRARMAASQ
jgi:hypothetical protein